MKTFVTALVLAGLIVAGTRARAAAAENRPRMLSHDVYFSLKDNSPEAKKALIAGCKKYLSNQPGTVWFAAGAIVAEHQREVNDRDFDVALHLVFQDKASHDKYQGADAHHKFIEEFKDNWKAVRVFDSWIDASTHGAVAAEGAEAGEAKVLRLPAGDSGFAGMIEGKVLARFDGRLIVAVDKVTRVWKANRATNPKSLVGQKVLVNVRTEEGRPAGQIARFVESLKPGATVTLDVAHRQGEALTILELTEEQRERVNR